METWGQAFIRYLIFSFFLKFKGILLRWRSLGFQMKHYVVLKHGVVFNWRYACVTLLIILCCSIFKFRSWIFQFDSTLTIRSLPNLKFILLVYRWMIKFSFYLCKPSITRLQGYIIFRWISSHEVIQCLTSNQKLFCVTLLSLNLFLIKMHLLIRITWLLIYSSFY